MNSEHIQSDAVKDYLLGTLPDDQASVIEERSFTDPAFFNEIRRIEIDLICAFLDDALTKEEHEQFRHRYLRIPRLKRLVNEVCEQREKNIPRSQSVTLRISVAAALVCIAVVGFVILRKELTQPPVHKASVETPGITLFLEPGVTMGAGSETRKLALPLQAQPIALIAELPGQTVSAEYVARVFSIGRDGSQQNVFSSGRIRSVSRTGGQQVTVVVSSTDLPPGDYIMELQGTGGKASEAYVFRVAAAHE